MKILKKIKKQMKLEQLNESEVFMYVDHMGEVEYGPYIVVGQSVNHGIIDCFDIQGNKMVTFTETRIIEHYPNACIELGAAAIYDEIQ